MESQNKGPNNGATETGVRAEAPAASKRKLRGCDAVLRLLSVALCVAAAAVFGLNKEETTVPLTLIPLLPSLDIPVTAKWHYLSAFVFFFVANVIACGYGGFSLGVALINRGRKRGITGIIILFDLAMLALLFSSVGSALAVGLIAYKGNSHLQWRKVCDVFGRFCDQAAVAIGLSAAAAVVFFLLVVLATFSLLKEH